MSQTGIIIVDHGSRRAESNLLLEEVARLFGERFADRYGIVEPAHMELAEPSIATAYGRCVTRGATRIVVSPFFLGPGKHWTKDIPQLTAAAAAAHPGTRYHVTMPLGVDELMLELLNKRIEYCMSCEYVCSGCAGTIRSGEEGVIEEAAAPQPTHAGQAAICNSCPYNAAGVPLPGSEEE